MRQVEKIVFFNISFDATNHVKRWESFSFFFYCKKVLVACITNPVVKSMHSYGCFTGSISVTKSK